MNNYFFVPVKWSSKLEFDIIITSNASTCNIQYPLFPNFNYNLPIIDSCCIS